MIQRNKTPVWPVEWVVAGHSKLNNLETPTTVADRLGETPPLKISREISGFYFKAATLAEKARFDALERVGFNVDREAVLNDCVVLRRGGYYVEIGTSARIAAGDIKVKSRDPIKRFVEHGLELESGDVVEADLVVFATGYESDPRIAAANVVGEEVARSMTLSGGLDEDGDFERFMLPFGRALWLIEGPANVARFYSRFIALQIQAELLGKPFPDCQWEGSGAGQGNA